MKERWPAEDGFRPVILHTFVPSRGYVHWPSVWLGVLLTCLAVGLWLILSWAGSRATAAPVTDGPLGERLPATPPKAPVGAEMPAPEADHEPGLVLRITVYGPPAFPREGRVARWPMTVGECLDWADSLGLTGICAVSPDTPWYARVRDEMPPILHVEGLGVYLCVDRTAAWITGTIDLWVEDPWPGGTYFSTRREVAE